MKKQIFSFLLSLSLLPGVAAQTGEARKIYEMGSVACSHLMNTVPDYYLEAKSRGSKLYVVYYEGKHYVVNIWNKKLKQYESKLLNPRRGDALSRAEEIKLFLKDYKLPPDNLVLVNGGYRYEFTLEFWIVPENAAPKLTPTLQEKEMTFRKGKPFKPRRCARIYDGL